MAHVTRSQSRGPSTAVPTPKPRSVHAASLRGESGGRVTVWDPVRGLCRPTVTIAHALSVWRLRHQLSWCERGRRPRRPGWRHVVPPGDAVRVSVQKQVPRCRPQRPATVGVRGPSRLCFVRFPVQESLAESHTTGSRGQRLLRSPPHGSGVRAYRAGGKTESVGPARAPRTLVPTPFSQQRWVPRSSPRTRGPGMPGGGAATPADASDPETLHGPRGACASRPCV